MTKNVSVPEGYKKTELGVIPEEWRIFQIDQLANINRESRDPTKNSEEFFYYIDIDAVENGTGLIKNPKRLFGKEAPSRARRVIHKDDIIMSTVRPYHKAFALVPHLYDNQICSTGFAVFSCGKNLDPKYLLQSIFSDKVIDQCTSMMAGGQYPALNTTQVSKLKITAPPLPEQQKIASILSKVDEQIEQTEQIIEKTELLKKGLMQKLLTKGIGHTKFKKTELGEIPEEWKVIGIADIASKEKNSFKRGPFGGSLKKEIFVSKGYKVYEQKNAIYNNLEIGNYFITKEKYEEMEDFSIKKDDIIISCSGTLGRIAIVPNSFTEGIINQALLKITIDQNRYSVMFIKYLLESDYVQNKVVDTSLGSAMKNMASMKIIKNTKICVSPLPEQQKIASILSKVDSQIQDNQNYLHKLQELKKGLMQDLLTGRVRVRV